jgi:endonuclease/exonuclease/phosphatase family metal-dependent hydrolase
MGLPRRRAGIALPTIGLLLALALTACDSGDDSEAEAGAGTSAATPADEPMRLDVLVYNIEYGGGPETDRVMREIDADVVGVLESYERLPRIAERTGYPYYNVSLQLLSKYPIHEPSEADGLYGLIEVRPGYVIPFFNVHLDYVAWGPRALKNGKSVASVIASENEVRTSALDEPLEAMEELTDEGYPVFLTGDFNQPSSLDYTEETVGTRPGIDEPVPWPVSEELFDLGFRDTYREAHPDPVKDPGITHRSGERIDYVYAGGPSKTLDSKLVGERGTPDAELEFRPWTSDHFAVLSTFEVTPVAMPTMVSVNARLGDVGDEVTLAYNAEDSDENEIAIVPEGGDPAAARERLDASGTRGEVVLDTAGMDAGGYEAVLLDGEGEEVARIPFWLRDPRADLRLSTDRRTYDAGEPIEVEWADGPANRWDWLGVYEASASDPKRDDYLVWGYTGGHASGTVPPSTDGSATIGPESQGSAWPLPPGDYVVHYLLADQYDSAGSTSFTVTR